MSDKDDWMKGIGVNVQALNAGGAPPPGKIDLFPPSLQQIADAPPPPPPPPPAKPPPPPDGVLARFGDGRKFWRPATAGSATPPGADKDWLEDMLRFYRSGSPSPADPGNATCSFNGATVPMAAALDIVDAQVKLNGYAPDRSTATAVLKALVKEGADSASLGDQVGSDVGKRDLAADIAKLGALPMPQLLAALDRMKAQKTFDPFCDQLGDKTSVRLGAAVFTVQGRFADADWQSALPKLSPADRAAVIMRAPAKIRPVTPGPARAGEKPEEPIEVEAIGAGSKDGVELQVSITAHSPLGLNLGETQGTVHIGPDGKISQFELDITAFQATLTGKGSVAEITATVSGNATIDMAKDGTHIAPDGINAQVKAELAAQLNCVPVLKGVKVKGTATYGTSGGSVTFGLEFPIPGS